MTRAEELSGFQKDAVETVILELEVRAQHLDLEMVGKDDNVVAVLYHRDLAMHPNVPIQSEDSQDQRAQFFTDFAGSEAMKHQVTQNLDWQLQTMRYPAMNNPPNAPELLLSKNLHGPATQLLRLVTPPPLAVQMQVLLQDQEEPSFHQDRDHDRHRPHLCSFGSISPTVQPLDFSVHVISHTGPNARSSERRHEPRLFGQPSEIAVVVQNLIDCLQVLVLPLHGHIEFRNTTVTDCIRQMSVVHTMSDELVNRRIWSSSSIRDS